MKESILNHYIKERMKISIIVPVYNVEQYIKECFDSIAVQTYKGNIECIFVDDCGQDDSVSVLKKLIAEYKGPIQFCIVHHEHNKGLSGARNTGIRKASGDYLYFLDSDDTVTPDCIEKLVMLVEKYPGVEMVQGSTKSKHSFFHITPSSAPEYSANHRWIKKTMLRRCVLPMTAWNRLVQTQFVLQHQLFFVDRMIHEDEVWNFMLAKYLNKVAYCYEVTYNYRDNQEGIMHQVESDQNRYLPVVDYLSKHISKPLVCSELECVFSLLGEKDSFKLYDKYLNNIHYSKFAVHCLLKMKNHVDSTTKFQINGIIWRILYKAWFWLVELTF